MKTILDTLPSELVDYVRSDYQDNVWYNGDEPAGTVEELNPYWDEYVTDRKEQGIPVPEGLNTELYVAIWSAIYDLCKEDDNE